MNELPETLDPIRPGIDAAGSVEIRSYALLEKLGVPTLPVHGRSDNAIVLEDLEVSPTWRLAREADCEKQATGRAVAGISASSA